MKKLTPAAIRMAARSLADEGKQVNCSTISWRLEQANTSTVTSIINLTLGLRAEIDLLNDRVIRMPSIRDVKWVALPWLAQQLSARKNAEQMS